MRGKYDNIGKPFHVKEIKARDKIYYLFKDFYKGTQLQIDMYSCFKTHVCDVVYACTSRISTELEQNET